MKFNVYSKDKESFTFWMYFSVLSYSMKYEPGLSTVETTTSIKNTLKLTILTSISMILELSVFDSSGILKFIFVSSLVWKYVSIVISSNKLKVFWYSK